MKKLIAGFMTALMALLTVTTPVLAATALGDYPGFLAGADGTLDAYVVIGSDAAVSDVVGAVDLASRLAEVGEATVTEDCPGSSAAVDGISKDTITINRGYLDNFFPGNVRSFHLDKLKTGTYSWNGANYDYYEDIALGNDQIYTSHDFSTSGINGTQSMVVPTDVLKYRYVFKKAINLTSKSGLGTLASPEYTYPINIELLGKTFQIVGLGLNQVKMLSGSVGTATATTPVVYGDYSVYSDLGDSGGTWARVIVKDSAGNTVATEVINDDSDKSLTSLSLTIKVTAVRALTDGTVVGTDVVVGALNAIEKTYPASCDISGTGTSDYKFPGETEWCIQAAAIGGTTASGDIDVNDRIEVVYKPSTTQYIKMTATDPSVSLPNDYGKVGFIGWNYDTWATLTFTPVTGKVGYWDDGMTGASNITQAASNLAGIEIASDVAGSIVDPNNANGYDKAYILFNYTLTSGFYPVMVGFWDSVNSRIAVDLSDNIYYQVIGAADTNFTFNFTLSYSNGAAVGDQQFLNITIMDPANTSTTVNGVGSGAESYFGDFYIGRSGSYNNSVMINYVNKTTTWSTTAAPQFRLYTTSTGQAKDVQVYSTDTSGVEQKSDIGIATQDVVADSGAVVVAPATYSGSDKVLVKIPAQVLYAKMYIGELGGTTAGSEVSYTSYPSVPVTSAIAKLDTEMSALKTAKHVVLVGGPCINDLVAELATAGKFTYSCASWPGRDFGLIEAIDDGFATGKVALVVAGTRADDTRVATSALQLFDTKLTGQTAASVEVTGTVGAPVVA
jgi:hypothetical protein